jgi:hypothetical protein
MPNLTTRMKTSLKRATRVLKLVDLSSLTKKEREEVVVEAYANGREHGYSVVVYGLGVTGMKLSFAENRNSDCIVVYIGKPLDFAMGGNIPDEEVYRHGAHYFSAADGDAAAEKAAAAFIQSKVVAAACAAAEAMKKALKDKEAA